MKSLLFFIFFGLTTFSWSQNLNHELWLATGLSYQPVKRWTVATELNQRYNNYGLATIFPQISVKYKLTKWLRPSIDYRWISSRSYLDPYNSSHRLNVNLQGTLTKKRLNLGLRLRYQYSFNRLSSQYDAEFDQAWRIRPSVEFDIKNFPLSPIGSAEFFYDPSHHQGGQQFNRIRYFAGCNVDLNSPHSINFGLYLDEWINAIPRVRLMYTLAYSFAIETDKKKDKTKK